MTPENGNGDWRVWQKHVLASIRRLEEGVESVEQRSIQNREDVIVEIGEVKTAIATLKVKAGIWGLVAGAIPVCVALGWFIIKG